MGNERIFKQRRVSPPPKDVMLGYSIVVERRKILETLVVGNKIKVVYKDFGKNCSELTILNRIKYKKGVITFINAHFLVFLDFDNKRSETINFGSVLCGEVELEVVT